MGLVQKSFSDIITFSRSSNATRVGPTGVLEYAPHNLILQSQTFNNASWLLLDSSISANSAAAPDGTVTADKLVENTANSNHTVYQAGITTVTATVSVYAKAAGRSNLIIRQYQADTEVVSANFDLSAGTVSKTLNQGTTFTSPLYSITPVGNGWYRCTVTATRSSGTTVVAFDLSNTSNPTFRNGGDVNYTGDGTSGIYLWGAQLSVGPYALDYTPTTSAAVYGPRFDYNGSGVTIVEPVSRNLVTYSEQFDNAGWTKTDATVTANTTTAPDGTVTADLMYPTTTGTYRATLQSNSGVSGQVYTASFYIKSAGFQWVALMTSAGGNIGVYFDVINGAKGTEASGTGTITSVGNGWFRCTITTTASSSTIYSGVTVVDANNSITATTSGTSGIYIWGAQLEVGSTATAYMVSGATNGFRAVPVVSGSATARGLLIEEQRTNLTTYSEQFNNAAWTKTNATVTANTDTAPDGTVTADTITFTDAFGDAANFTAVNPASTAYTGSVWLKGSGTLIIRISNNVDQQFTTTVTLTSTLTRYTVTGTFNATAGQVFLAISRNNLTATSVVAWGAQLEAGSFATSYIPTLASTVTRSADVASVNTLSPWWNGTEGTFLFDFNQVATVKAIAVIGDDTFNNSLRFNIVEMARGVGPGFANIVELGTAQNGSHKLAVAIKLNDYAGVFDGGAVSTDTSASLVPSPNVLGIGRDYGTNGYMNGWMRRLAFYPRRLTNAELQALTA